VQARYDPASGVIGISHEAVLKCLAETFPIPSLHLTLMFDTSGPEHGPFIGHLFAHLHVENTV